MTKNEFIQEAALRILARDSESSMISIADYAAELAYEVWKRMDKDTKPMEIKEVKMAVPDMDDHRSIVALANEINRLEHERMKDKNYRIRTARTHARFLRVCDQYNVESVSDLLQCGRASFRYFHNVGPLTMSLVDEALRTLYGMDVW